MHSCDHESGVKTVWRPEPAWLRATTAANQVPCASPGQKKLPQTAKDVRHSVGMTTSTRAASKAPKTKRASRGAQPGRTLPPSPMESKRQAATAPFRDPRRQFEAKEYLLRSVRERLAIGHWKVACRRYMMLVACHFAVPEPLTTRCEELLSRCSAKELQDMHEGAASWHELTQFTEDALT